VRVTLSTRAACAATAVGFAIGLPTMARDVGFIDRGELAAVASTLGIAHPTGYPLLTMLGRLATLLPLRPVIALDVLAVAMVAFGLGAMVKCFDAALARVDAAAPASRRAWAALGGALGVGLTETWWRQSNGFEAYALHALMLPLVAWVYVRWLDALDADRGFAFLPASRFGYVVGLALANHLTLGLLAPACIVTALVVSGFHWRTVPRLVAPAPAWLLALSAYLYLPIRAAQEPRFAWGDPREGWRFLSHVTARQYRGWFFSSWDVAREQPRSPRLVGDPLIEAAGAQILGLLGEFEFAGDRRRRAHPADAEARCERLGEAAEIDDAGAVVIVRGNRPGFVFFGDVRKVQVAIGIVLDDEHVATLGPFQNRAAALQRQQAPGRILKVRHQI